MKKEIVDEELIKKINKILKYEYSSLSIKEITRILKEEYLTVRSPQFVLRHLQILEKRKKVRETKNV